MLLVALAPGQNVEQCNNVKTRTFWGGLYQFSRKVLIEDTIFAFPTGDGTAILRGHLSHAKVLPFAAEQRQYLHFSVH